MYDVANHVSISPFYFNKGFNILCGYSIAEYIRNRRLALAGEELITGNITVMELAMKYGYDSPDSFTKALQKLFQDFMGIHLQQCVRMEQWLKLSHR